MNSFFAQTCLAGRQGCEDAKTTEIDNFHAKD
jgi:hypothetical protein